MANAYATQVIDNPLCDRLKTKFSGRGLANVGSRVDNTDYRPQRPVSNVEKAARAVATPFEEEAAYEAAGETKQYKISDIKKSKAKAQDVLTKEEIAIRRTRAYEKTTPFRSGAYAAAYARAAEIRVACVDYAVREQSRKYSDKPSGKKSVFHIADIFDRSFWSGIDNGAGERRIRLPKISKSLFIGIAIAVIILFVLIYSFSQITAIKNEISTLERQKETLSADIDDLKLQIDLKNDVRVLEEKAEDIGMVKSNKVESRYISLSTGEHIEVVEDETSGADGNYGIFSTMMSSVSANWNNLVDYFS